MGSAVNIEARAINVDVSAPRAHGRRMLVSCIGLVYRDLADHEHAMSSLLADERIATIEMTVQAPLFKGNDAIKDALKDGPPLREKFVVYWQHGVVDEQARVAFSTKFRALYTKKHAGGVERQDLFMASGDIFVVQLELLPPMQLPVPRKALDAIEQGPHDKELLTTLRSGAGVDRELWKVEVRVFFDHALNPRRHLDEEVLNACHDLDTQRPYVLEVSAGAGVAGYAKWVLDDHVKSAGGRAVWLQA